MSIRFPKMHIAASVVNRILNVHDELEHGAKAQPVAERTARDEPAPTDPNLEGALLNEQLIAPAAPSDAPDTSTADAIALRAGGLL